MNLSIDLRFYFITDDACDEISPLQQVKTAIQAGAGVVQYRNKSFSASDLEEAVAIADLCRLHGVPFIVNDDITLALALDASGVHLGQQDFDPALARRILGSDRIIGVSVSTPDELSHTDLGPCDYLGTGPVYFTGTKADASDVIGTGGLAEIVSLSSLPVVAIGGIGPEEVSACFNSGACGVAVISAITRAQDPLSAAIKFGQACGTKPRPIRAAWQDEFGLIDKIMQTCRPPENIPSALLVGAGDDAALLENISRPVISTDAQHEDIHFRRCWQSFSEIGYKAAETAFSDLAASYAQPLAMFVNLSLPKSISEEDVVEIYKGINHSLASRRAVLAGGNVASAKSLAIDLFVIGRAESDLFPLRSAAKPGYGIYATGPLGLARAGLDCLIRGDKQFPALVEAFKKPKARFDAARILADHRVKCTMDISDGLAGDVRHMAMASHVTAAMDLSRVPVDLSLDMFCRKYKALPREIMAAGGEDYELLFACPKEVFEELKQKLPEACSVGICLPYSGVPVTGLPEGIRGFDHALIKIRQEVNQ